MTKNCENCWFYCHSDGKCYVIPTTGCADEFGIKVNMSTACSDWVFDGLQDWEREPEEALVTMEVVA